jgi:O-antigen/teichoic acid export membrane protein
MASTRKSVIFSVVTNLSSITTSLILVVIVARWLEPLEIGAFAVAYAIFSLLEPLRQSQLIAYVIQADAVNVRLMRGVTFVGLMTLLLVLAITAIIVGLLFGPLTSPQTGKLLAMMSPGFMVMTLVQPAHAVLMREMRFGFITSVDVSGGIVKAAVTIALLFMGLRAEALAWGVLAELCVRIAYLSRVDRSLTLVLPATRHTAAIWRFCTRFTGAQFLNRIPASASEILVGGFLGLTAAGFFNRSSKLVRTLRSGIESSVIPVAMAAFSKLKRDEDRLPKKEFLLGIALLTGVIWPALAVFVAVAEPLILTAYGPRWETTIPLARVLALAAMIDGASAMAPTLLASVGKVDLLFRRNLVILGPRLLILFVTVQIDLTAVVWGEVVTMAIMFAVTQSLLWREFGIAPVDLFRALWRSGVAAGVSALAAFGLLQVPQVASQSHPVQTLVALAFAGTILLASLFVVRHPLSIEIARLVRRVPMLVANLR